MGASGRRNGFIELCRFLFALCIISHHCIFFQNHGHIPVIRGYIATDFFFILTGFFLTDSACKAGKEYDSTIGCIMRMLKKVFPYFLGAWMISFILAHASSGKTDIITVGADFVKGIPQLFLLSMAGLSGGTIGLYDYVATGWYLSALAIAVWTVYPLLRIFCRPSAENRKNIFVGGIAPFITLLCYGYIGFNYNSMGVVNERISFTYLGCLRAIAGICLGITSNGVARKLRQNELTKAGDYVISAAQMLLLLLSVALMGSLQNFYDIIQLILFAALVTISFGFDTGLNKVCSQELFFRFGKFSMLLFISQGIVYTYQIFPTQAYGGRSI